MAAAKAPVAATAAPAAASGSKKKHIMISFEEASHNFAESLRKELTNEGLNVWMDTEGMVIRDEVKTKAVEEAEIFIPIFTKAYMSDTECKSELEYAVKQPGIRFVSIRADDSTGVPSGFPKPKVDAEFHKGKGLPFNPTSEKGIPKVQELVKAIYAVLSKESRLSLYIACTPKQEPFARMIVAELQGGKNRYVVNLSTEVRKDYAKSKARDKDMLDQTAEKLIMECHAMIALVGPDTEEDKSVRMDIACVNRIQKTLPTVFLQILERHVTPYPPASIAYAFSNQQYHDFTAVGNNKSKMTAAVSLLRKSLTVALMDTAAELSSSNYEFKSKCVGNWTPDDVCNWLRSKSMHSVVRIFGEHKVNGKLLLSLTDEELKTLLDNRLQEKLVLAAVQELLSVFPWTEQDVADWFAQYKLPNEAEVTKKLRDAGVDGKTLFLFSESDIPVNPDNIVMKRRIMLDIQALKEKHARVPGDPYRFKKLGEYLPVVANDEVESRVRFAQPVIDLLQEILGTVIPPESLGVTPEWLSEVLCTIIRFAAIYHTKYPTKTLWRDGNPLEIGALLQGEFKAYLDKFSARHKSHDYGSSPKEPSNPKTLPKEASIASAAASASAAAAASSSAPKHKEGAAANNELIALFINSIYLRLFDVLDRNVGGYLSKTEMFMGLDLIVFGTMVEKFWFAVSIIANKDEDGKLSEAQMTNFYAKFNELCKKTKQSYNDKPFIPGSAMYFIADQTATSNPPALLNQGFTTPKDVKWSAKVRDVLGNGDGGFHTISAFEKAERKFTLVHDAGSTEDFILTNLWIGKDHQSKGRYLRNAKLWVSAEADFAKATNGKPPTVEIATVATDDHAFNITLDPPAPGRYIHVELIDSHEASGPQSDVINLELLLLFGVEGNKIPASVQPILDTNVLYYRALSLPSGRRVLNPVHRKLLEKVVTVGDTNAELKKLLTPHERKIREQVEFLFEASLGNDPAQAGDSLGNVLPLIHMLGIFRGFSFEEVFYKPMNQ